MVSVKRKYLCQAITIYIHPESVMLIYVILVRIRQTF
jgi:hypothetical protein